MQPPPPRTTQELTHMVTDTAFIPDRRQLATGSEYNMARVWDLSAGKQSAAIEVSVRGGGGCTPTPRTGGDLGLWVMQVLKGGGHACVEGGGMRVWKGRRAGGMHQFQ